MPPIVTSAEIDRPAAEVFACAIDPARFSQWQKGVVDGHLDGPADASGLPLMVRREARKEMPDNMAALKRMIETS